MADDIFAAVRGAISKELQEVRERQKQQDEQVAEVRASLENLHGRAEEHQCEALRLSKTCEHQAAALEALGARARHELEEFVDALHQRLERVESDADGCGGLEQLRQRLDAASDSLGKVGNRIEEHSRVVGFCKSRTDTLDTALKDLCRKSEAACGSVQANEQRLCVVEGQNRTVTDRQQIVEDSVAQKYASLWEDVLVAIEEVRTNHAHALKDHLERRTEQVKSEGQAYVRYMMQLAASVQDERRKLADAKDLVTLWREQAWVSARRRTGIRWLCRTLEATASRRTRKAFSRWVRSASIDELARQLREDYQRQLPDVLGIIEGTGLRSRCDGLESCVDEIRVVKCSTVQLQQAIASMTLVLEERMGHFQATRTELLDKCAAVRVSLDEQATRAQEQQNHFEERLNSIDERLEQLAKATRFGEQLEDHEQKLTSIAGSLAACATSQEVQTIMKDTLLMWSSIKQLDAAKLDKRDMDAFTDAAAAKDEDVNRKLQQVQAEVTGMFSQDISRIDSICSELGTRLDSSCKQVQQWEKMWEGLAGHVEELVTKMADLQQSAGLGRLPSMMVAAVPAPTVRPLSAQRGRPDIPRLRSAGSASEKALLPGPAAADALFVGPAGNATRRGGTKSGIPRADSADAGRWASTRGATEGGSDRAVAIHSARPTSRPRSASSSRRSVDRAKG